MNISIYIPLELHYAYTTQRLLYISIYIPWMNISIYITLMELYIIQIIYVYTYINIQSILYYQVIPCIPQNNGFTAATLAPPCRAHCVHNGLVLKDRAT